MPKPNHTLDTLTLEDMLKLVKKFGSRNLAADSLDGVSRAHFKTTMREREQGALTDRAVIQPVIVSAPKRGVKRFICSAAQDSTSVNQGFMDNLQAYAKHLGNCDILISGFTYNKSLFEDHDKSGKSVFFADAVEPYLTNDRTILGDKVMFCGEYNRLPTTGMPLSGYRAYTRDKWGIFPHAKVHLESVPRMKGVDPKVVMTTGCVTHPNYIPKSAGIKAEFYHTYGAVIVEITPDGQFFPRHLIADKEGSFCDLWHKVEYGKVHTDQRIKALIHGDIHHRMLDKVCCETTWGFDPITLEHTVQKPVIDILDPMYQFFHDLTHFEPRNHHNIKDPHFMYSMMIQGKDSVEAEMDECSKFLEMTRRSSTHSVVVNSNHDEAFRRWLKTTDYRDDPVNAVFFLESQAEYYRQIRDGNFKPLIFEKVLRASSTDELAGVQFLGEDESFMLNDIEYGMHGHTGANGGRTTPRTLSMMGPKAVTAHTHSPSAYDGVWTTGVLGSLDMGYNTGLSSWAHASALTYMNDKHAIIFKQGDKWWA